MATSGSFDYATSRDGLIAFALEKCGVIPIGATPSAVQVTSAARELNFLAKAWQADGLQLWARKIGYLFLAANTTSYTLGPGGSNATRSYVKTAVATAASSGATSIVVDSISGISASDKIGIELDNGTLQWTTVSGAPSGSTITLAAALTDDVAVDNTVFTYTTIIERPLRVLQALRLDTDDVSTPLEVQTIDEFHELPNLTTDGPVTQIAFQPTLSTATMFVWPQTDDVSDVIKFWYHRPFEDFDATGDEPDFPQEWYLALGYGLAQILCDTYGVPASAANKIETKAMYYHDLALSFDQEQGSVYFEPDDRG